MSEITNESLKKIGTGTIIVFIGTIIWMLFGFVGRVIIVRYITQSEYGIFSLALVLLNIFVLISTLGLQEGVARQIAFYRGNNDTLKVRSVVLSSLQIVVITSVLLSFVFFFTSDFISTNFFHSPELSTALKIFSIAIPFLVLTNIFISIFRGFGRVDVKVYFNDILDSVLKISFFLIVIALGLSFIGVIYAYMASSVVTCIAFAVYAIKKSPLPIKREKSIVINPIRKKLLLFSLPLLVFGVLNIIMTCTDTLMLGYFKSTEIVGLYNSALPFANFISIALASMSFIHVPIASQLYSQNLMAEMKRTYAVLTKWVFAIGLPLFLIFFLFPGIVLDFFFGSDYIQASIALRILALGFFVHTFVGPNGSTLTALGQTRVIMWASLVCTMLNIALNAFLIPIFGISGAAVSSAFAFALINIIVSIRLYQLSGIHPFTKNYLKPIIMSIIVIFLIYVIAKNFLIVTFWMLLPLFLIFLVTYGISLLLTKSFDKEDIMTLLEIEKRLGLDLSLIKKIFAKFL